MYTTMSEITLSSAGRQASVLVVDDEAMLADLLYEWVNEKWPCEAVYSGQEALEVVDGTIDLVLLDRQMPDLSGEEVLQTIRDQHGSIQVLMVSAIEPNFDILDLPFDGYLQKPVDRPTVQEAIEGLLIRRTYEPAIREFFSAVAKIEILEAVKSPAELAEDERFIALKSKADDLRQRADATLGRVTRHVSEMHDVEADD